MKSLQSIEMKAFVPSKNFESSIDFYKTIGFTLASNQHGIAYFHHQNCAFLLQDFYQEQLCDNFMMHLLVKDIDQWHQSIGQKLANSGLSYSLTPISAQPWGMRDFCLTDPSGVLWRIGENQ
ncbi:glyoxalase [Agarivorans aestuarii]|uniref:Glyoxalase n=1 Tax=Agarivorans aestuarii TaxID=1563703 RepID=A0ABU7G267_9ALTE|nr:VOC family protein [Agarivorans aestuarii]MEE1673507.1 glyoxalase [Agarivorans aestuarii]